MAGQELSTVISINARTGDGFSRVGNTLSALASQLNGISSKLIAFGEDSVKVYREYESALADAEVALSTQYGRSSKELESVMSSLDGAATEWAASTIFHTNDVANAISEAAHAGWDYEQIMTGVPAAIELAQAGGIDLSDAVNYIVKSTNAMGLEFENTSEFIDQWTYAANSSATTIDEVGEAMLRMGATMKFAGGTEELLTLIAATANAGSTGSEAGTMIRNAMLRLISPTDKASKAMEELGATSDEVAAILNDENLAQAMEMLEGAGFSVYDQNGNLKNMIDVYTELDDALAGIAGGYDKISTNKDALKIISAIFPTRSTTEALALMEAAHNEWDGLYEDLENGAASGYGEYAAATMMDTLSGRLEIFESKVERLKQVVGAELSEDVSNVVGNLGDFADSLANLDEEKFSALTTGLEVIAVSAPALLTTGAALRFIGYMLTPTGLIGTGIVTLTAVAAALGEIKEFNFENNFGTADLDSEAILNSMNEISSSFDTAYASVSAFKEELESAAESYQNNSSTFAADLLTNMVTGATLSQGQKDSMMQSLNAMITDALNTSSASLDTSTAFMEYLWGDDATNSTAFTSMVQGLIDDYETDSGEINSIGQKLRDELTAAWEGGISPDEYDKILATMKDLNAKVAEAAAAAADEEAQIELESMIHKGQTASFDSMQEVTSQIEGARDERLSQLAEDYEKERARQVINGASDEELAEFDAQYDKRVTGINQDYANASLRIWDSQLKQSDYGDAYAELAELASSVLKNEASLGSAADVFSGNFDSGTKSDLTRYFGEMIQSAGGYDALISSINAYSAAGDTANADYLSSLFAMSQILTDGSFIRSVDLDGAYGTAYAFMHGGNSTATMVLKDDEAAAFGYNQYNPVDYAQSASSYTIEEATKAIDQYGLKGFVDGLNSFFTDHTFISGSLDMLSEEEQTTMSNILSYISANYDLEGYKTNSLAAAQGTDYYDSMNKVYNSEEGDYYAMAGLLNSQNPEEYKINAVVDEVNDDAILSKLEEDSNHDLMQNLVVGMDDVGSRIASYQGRTISVGLSVGAQHLGFPGLYAEGGRATTASIFGEAGAEWAIPEEHSERTADLLNAARSASGFTWPELISRYGGFNANANNTPTTLVYSPTINANDSSGIAEALMEDKSRLEKWYRERKMRDEMEVFA